MHSDSRSVSSNQQEVHPDLISRFHKHQSSRFDRPISQSSRKIFEDSLALVEANPKPIILDSGCGVGRSSRALATIHPNHWVIAVDQSAHRLAKQHNETLEPNLIMVRANLIDYWRLAAEKGLQLDKHFILYPNPWPKKKHLMRRWHGHPVFKDMLKLGGNLELRTNWEIYAQEFAQVINEIGYRAEPIDCFEPETYLTHFEEKYHRSGQKLYCLKVRLG